METKNEMDSRSGTSTFCIDQRHCNGCMECLKQGPSPLVHESTNNPHGRKVAAWVENDSDMVNVGSDRFGEYHEFVEVIRTKNICRENLISECG